MKTKKTITFLAALAATFVCTSAIAESRIWTDSSGKTIEAEQIKLLNNQVLLRLVDGREIKVSLDTLSAGDRALAMLNQPPTLDVRISAKTSRSNSSLRDAGRASRVQVQEESIGINVRIRKSSSAVYEAALTAELYVIGERENGYEVLSKTESTFGFSKEGGTEHAFSSAPLTVEKLADRGPGVEYTGYLLVVTDSRGEVVELESSSGSIERAAAAILAAHEGTRLNTDFVPQEHVASVHRPRRF